MQEEVNQKTMALSIRATKLTGKVLAAAFLKVVRAAKAHHQKADPAQTVQLPQPQELCSHRPSRTKPPRGTATDSPSWVSQIRRLRFFIPFFTFSFRSALCS